MGYCLFHSVSGGRGTGRPILISDRIDNWDTLAAAWLPGTEGQGWQPSKVFASLAVKKAIK